MDRNSVTNQDIKGKFVSREVKACFSYEMDAIIKAEAEGLPTWEEVENLFLPKCPNCGHQEKEDAFDCEEYPEGHKNEGHPRYVCPSCREELEEMPDTEPQEVLEWWIVSDYLYRKLAEKGEPVLQ